MDIYAVSDIQKVWERESKRLESSGPVTVPDLWRVFFGMGLFQRERNERCDEMIA